MNADLVLWALTSLGVGPLFLFLRAIQDRRGWDHELFYFVCFAMGVAVVVIPAEYTPPEYLENRLGNFPLYVLISFWLCWLWVSERRSASEAGSEDEIALAAERRGKLARQYWIGAAALFSGAALYVFLS